jgi:hypothetical protein
MNPLSNRFNSGLPTRKGKAKDSEDTADAVLVSPPSTSSPQKEIFPQLPALKDFPPLVEQPQPSIGTPTSPTASFEALSESEIASLFLPPTGDTAEYATISTMHSEVSLSVVAVEESTDTTAITSEITLPRVDQVLLEQSSRETGNGDISTSNGRNGVLKKVTFSYPPPGPTDWTDRTKIRPPSPHPCNLGNQSGRSNDVYVPPTWSEGAEEDLVAHLVPRERTRQEVLWEIVASEER